MLPECPICGKKVDNLTSHIATHNKKHENNRSKNTRAIAPVQNDSSIRIARLKPGRKRGPVCAICGRPGHAHALCAMHYMRQYRSSHSTST